MPNQRIPPGVKREEQTCRLEQLVRQTEQSRTYEHGDGLGRSPRQICDLRTSQSGGLVAQSAYRVARRAGTSPRQPGVPEAEGRSFIFERTALGPQNIMRYAVHRPDGSSYDYLTLEEIRKAFNKGELTKDYLVQESDRANWQKLGVLLGLEQAGEDATTPTVIPAISPTSSRTMSSEQNRGRWLLLIPFAAFLALDVSFAALEILRAGFSGLVPVLVPSAVRLFLTVLLMSAVWAGIRWARWVVVALSLGTGLYLAYPASSQFRSLFMFLAVIYLSGGALIGFSKSVTSFLSFQRQGK